MTKPEFLELQLTSLTFLTASTKSFRPTEILRSNRMVYTTMNTLETIFIDPFDAALDIGHLVSGAPTSHSVYDSQPKKLKRLW